jgi:hypothetical protein
MNVEAVRVMGGLTVSSARSRSRTVLPVILVMSGKQEPGNGGLQGSHRYAFRIDFSLRNRCSSLQNNELRS